MTKELTLTAIIPAYGADVYRFSDEEKNSFDMDGFTLKEQGINHMTLNVGARVMLALSAEEPEAVVVQ